MIANGLIKVLLSTNYKVFIKMICLKDQKKRLASIKLEKNQKMFFYFAKLNKKAKFLGTELICPNIYRDNLSEPC